MMLNVTSLIKYVRTLIDHISTYGAKLRVLFIAFLFNLLIIYFIIIDPSHIRTAYYHLWIDIFLFVILVLVLLYAGILYCFSSRKNSQIASELLDLVLYLHIVVLISFVFLGFGTGFLGGNKLFFFNNYYTFDFYNYLLKVWVVFFSVLTLFLSKFIVLSSRYNLVEYPILISLSSFLLITVVSLYDLFAIFILIESIFFTTMCLSIFNFSKASVESCVKYFVQNVFVAGLSGFGILIIYFVCKSTNIFVVKEACKMFVYLAQQGCLSGETKIFAIFFFLGLVLFLMSIIFKIGIFPLHFYVPDIYEVSPYPVVFFFSAVVKPTFLFFFVKLIYMLFSPLNLVLFQTFFIYLALGSTLLGTIGALYQTTIKRFLGYTSINQFGFFILIFFLAEGSVDSIIFIFLYLFIYSLLLVPFIYILSFVGERRSKKNSVTISQFSELAYLNDFNFKYIISFSFFLYQVYLHFYCFFISIIYCFDYFLLIIIL